MELDLSCAEVKYDYSPIGQKAINTGLIFCFLKMLDLIETVRTINISYLIYVTIYL